MGRSDTDTPSVCCPRCGYDLRGEMQTWQTQCPLAGRCSECGLDFAWSDVVRHVVHPWLFEHQWRRQPLRSFAMTLWKALGPRRLFRSVRLEHRVRLRPLLSLILILLVLAYVLTNLASGVHECFRIIAGSRWGGARPPSSAADWARELLAHLVRPSEDYLYCLIACMAPLGTMLAMPALFVCLPITLRRAKVRFSHVLRAAGYSLILPLLVCALYAVCYYAAAAYHMHVYNRNWTLYQRTGTWHARDTALEWFVYYGDPYNWEFFDRSLAYLNGTLAAVVLAAPFVLWAFYWWLMACRRYLRLPHAAGVAGLLALTAGLAAGVAFVVWSIS